MRSPFEPGPAEPAHSVAEVYSNQTPPLLPSAEDLAAHVAALDLGDTPLHVLMLGVTPALFRLPWPEGTIVRAVDRSLPMIEHVWPGPVGTADVGDWTRLPFEDARFDRIVSDGGLAFFGPPSIEDARDELARVLRPGGLFVARLYVWDRSQRIDRIVDEVERGAIATANEMRIRSWSALQVSLGEGLVLGEAFDAIVARVGSPERLIELTDLEPEQFVPFLASAGSALRYTMWPSDALIEAWTGSGHFELQSLTVPAHRLGALCPVLAFRRTDTA